VDPHPPKM